MSGRPEDPAGFQLELLDLVKRFPPSYRDALGQWLVILVPCLTILLLTSIQHEGVNWAAAWGNYSPRWPTCTGRVHCEGTLSGVSTPDITGRHSFRQWTVPSVGTMPQKALFRHDGSAAASTRAPRPIR